uniref:putative polyvalent protein kinase domain-containing protein n=1 Tax=Verrucomicrobium spinosum TaxID=2736 RepID=UPI000B1F3BEC
NRMSAEGQTQNVLSEGADHHQDRLQFSKPNTPHENQSNGTPSKLDQIRGIPYVNRHGDSPTRRDAEAALGELRARSREGVDAGGSSRTDEAERLHSETESLVSWAKERGWFIDSSRFEELTSKLEQLEGGVERDVFYQKESGRVIKTTIPPFFGQQGTVKDYVNNIAWSNALFGDDIRFEGVVETSEGPAIVVSQPFVEGKKASKRRVRRWFESQGYVSIGYNRWRNPDTGVVLADAIRGISL